MSKFKVTASYADKFNYFDLEEKFIYDYEKDFNDHICVGNAYLRDLIETNLFEKLPLKFERLGTVTDNGVCFVKDSSLTEYLSLRDNRVDFYINMYSSAFRPYYNQFVKFGLLNSNEEFAGGIFELENDSDGIQTFIAAPKMHEWTKSVEAKDKLSLEELEKNKFHITQIAWVKLIKR